MEQFIAGLFVLALGFFLLALAVAWLIFPFWILRIRSDVTRIVEILEKKQLDIKK